MQTGHALLWICERVDSSQGQRLQKLVLSNKNRISILQEKSVGRDRYWLQKCILITEMDAGYRDG